MSVMGEIWNYLLSFKGEAESLLSFLEVACCRYYIYYSFVRKKGNSLYKLIDL